MATFNRTKMELKLDLQREYGRYLDRFPFLKDKKPQLTPERELDVHTWLSELYGSPLPPLNELKILVRNGLEVTPGSNPWNPA